MKIKWEYEDEEAEDYEWEYETEDEEGGAKAAPKADQGQVPAQDDLEEDLEEDEEEDEDEDEDEDIPDPFSSGPAPKAPKAASASKSPDVQIRSKNSIQAKISYVVCK